MSDLSLTKSGNDVTLNYIPMPAPVASISLSDAFEDRFSALEAQLGEEGYVTLLRTMVEALVDKVGRLEVRIEELENPNR